MKNNIFKFGLIVIFSVIFIACDQDESNDQITESISLEEVALTTKVDNGIEIISDTFLQTFEFEESLTKGPIHRFLPECAIVTIEFANTSKEVTVDFGSDGCEVRGRMIKGKLIMSYTADVDAKTFVIDYSLKDFFIDGVQFEGSKTVTRQKTNDSGNPQYLMVLDLVVTFIDGTKATRTGEKVRKWIEGSFNGNWGDNVFLITGAWETNFVNGNTHSTTITTALRREASCKFLISGVVDLVRTNYSGTLDYGNGECNNKALFTNINGEEREILL